MDWIRSASLSLGLERSNLASERAKRHTSRRFWAINELAKLGSIVNYRLADKALAACVRVCVCRVVSWRAGFIRLAVTFGLGYQCACVTLRRRRRQLH